MPFHISLVCICEYVTTVYFLSQFQEIVFNHTRHPLTFTNQFYPNTSKSTCPIVQAGACSIRSRLRRSRGWLYSIRSRLWRSYSALLVHYKKVKLKKKIDLHRIRNRHPSIVSRMHYHHSTLDNQLH